MAINGKRPENNFPNIKELYASLKEDERIVYDIETGYPYKVTKKYYDWYMALWEAARPQVFKDGEPIGTIIISGTGSNNDKFDIKDLFYNPTQWNLGNVNFEKD